MKELPRSWKIFRILCILQMIAVVVELTFVFGALFAPTASVILSLTRIAAYTAIFLFLYHGLSVLNYNYPDSPLSPRQKKTFNWLYLLSFLGIAILFARFLSIWRTVAPLLGDLSGMQINYAGFLFIIGIPTYVFLFHIVFLVGMYTLRKQIYKNTIETWEEQFGES